MVPMLAIAGERSGASPKLHLVTHSPSPHRIPRKPRPSRLRFGLGFFLGLRSEQRAIEKFVPLATVRVVDRVSIDRTRLHFRDAQVLVSELAHPEHVVAVTRAVLAEDSFRFV